MVLPALDPNGQIVAVEVARARLGAEPYGHRPVA